MNANKVFSVLDSPLFRRMYSVGYWSAAILACMRGHDVYILYMMFIYLDQPAKRTFRSR